MSTVDWAKLYSKGRCKIPGVPWNNEELNARYQLKIPAEYVRKGVLTLEDYDKARKEGDKNSPLLSIDESKEKLLLRAKELGIDATSDVREDDLIRLIEEEQKKLDEKLEVKQVVYENDDRDTAATLSEDSLKEVKKNKKEKVVAD